MTTRTGKREVFSSGAHRQGGIFVNLIQGNEDRFGTTNVKKWWEIDGWKEKAIRYDALYYHYCTQGDGRYFEEHRLN